MAAFPDIESEYIDQGDIKMNIARMHYNLDFVQKFYAAVPNGDDDLSEYFTEDFVITEAPDLPYGGAYRGKVAMRNLVDRINSMIEVSDVTLHRFTASEDTVIATLSFDLHLKDGSTERQYVAEEFIFSGYLVREVRPYYFDNALMHRG